MTVLTKRVIVKVDEGLGLSKESVRDTVEAKWRLSNILGFTFIKYTPGDNPNASERFNLHYLVPKDDAASAKTIAETVPGTTGNPAILSHPASFFDLDDTAGVDADSVGVSAQMRNQPSLVSLIMYQPELTSNVPLGTWRKDTQPNEVEIYSDGGVNSLPSINTHAKLGMSHIPFGISDEGLLAGNRYGIAKNSVKLKRSTGELIDINNPEMSILNSSSVEAIWASATLACLFWIDEDYKLYLSYLVLTIYGLREVGTTNPLDHSPSAASVPTSMTYEQAFALGEWTSDLIVTITDPA